MWLAIAKEVETVKVTRGENCGRDLSYHHPVREVSPIGMWHGDPITLRLPLKDLKTMGGDCRLRCCKLRIMGRSSAPPSSTLRLGLRAPRSSRA